MSDNKEHTVEQVHEGEFNVLDPNGVFVGRSATQEGADELASTFNAQANQKFPGDEGYEEPRYDVELDADGNAVDDSEDEGEDSSTSKKNTAVYGANKAGTSQQKEPPAPRGNPNSDKPRDNSATDGLK